MITYANIIKEVNLILKRRKQSNLKDKRRAGANLAHTNSLNLRAKFEAH